MSAIVFNPDKPEPLVDVTAVIPSVTEIAALERTRTKRPDGTDVGTFDTTTRPTAAEVTALAATARSEILGQLPDRLPARLYGRVKNAIALQTAILIESSYFRVQAGQSDVVPTYQGMVAAALAQLQETVDQSGRLSRRVDSVVVRGTGYEYDPWYPLPPPRQTIELEP